jgi:hypothetical protein
MGVSSISMTSELSQITPCGEGRLCDTLQLLSDFIGPVYAGINHWPTACSISNTYFATIADVNLAIGNNAMSRRKFGAMDGPMKTKQIIGAGLILSGVVCFWVESADKSQSDWKIDVWELPLSYSGYG